MEIVILPNCTTKHATVIKDLDIRFTVRFGGIRTLPILSTWWDSLLLFSSIQSSFPFPLPLLQKEELGARALELLTETREGPLSHEVRPNHVAFYTVHSFYSRCRCCVLLWITTCIHNTLQFSLYIHIPFPVHSLLSVLHYYYDQDAKDWKNIYNKN